MNNLFNDYLFDEENLLNHKNQFNNNLLDDNNLLDYKNTPSNNLLANDEDNQYNSRGNNLRATNLSDDKPLNGDILNNFGSFGTIKRAEDNNLTFTPWEENDEDPFNKAYFNSNRAFKKLRGAYEVDSQDEQKLDDTFNKLSNSIAGREDINNIQVALGRKDPSQVNLASMALDTVDIYIPPGPLKVAAAVVSFGLNYNDIYKDEFLFNGCARKSKGTAIVKAMTATAISNLTPLPNVAKLGKTGTSYASNKAASYVVERFYKIGDKEYKYDLESNGTKGFLPMLWHMPYTFKDRGDVGAQFAMHLQAYNDFERLQSLPLGKYSMTMQFDLTGQNNTPIAVYAPVLASYLGIDFRDSDLKGTLFNLGISQEEYAKAVSVKGFIEVKPRDLYTMANQLYFKGADPEQTKALRRKFVADMSLVGALMVTFRSIGYAPQSYDGYIREIREWCAQPYDERVQQAIHMRKISSAASTRYSPKGFVEMPLTLVTPQSSTDKKSEKGSSRQ